MRLRSYNIEKEPIGTHVASTTQGTANVVSVRSDPVQSVHK